MAFFDISKIQSYGVLNHDKQLQKSFPRMPEITPFRRKLFASTSGSQKGKYFVEVCSAACFELLSQPGFTSSWKILS